MVKILVIDDEAILRQEVVEWLHLEGYEAVDAEDGVRGVETAISDPPDLIICDITMPRLDGYGVLLKINAHPATSGTPFIFMTARTSHEDIRRGMELGADDYITKPFTHHELLTAIRTRLEKKAIIEQTYQHDIQSLREALEIEQEQRLLKSKLVAMVSHDFRNPLSSILSSAGLLKNYSDQLDEESRLKYFDFIEMSVVQLQQMLDDMLVVAQMESTKFEIKPTLVNINQFVKRIVEEFRVIHTDTHIIHFDSDFNDDFMIDQRLFRQIIANLISNAIKYSSNEAEVGVALAKNSEDLILQVQDQGIGIAQADLEKLFVDFHRGANVGTIAGTGLGLAIVKQAVDLHGGAIHVESEVNEGTTVTVRLPL